MIPIIILGTYLFVQLYQGIFSSYLSGSCSHGEAEPAELLPEDRLPAGEAAGPAGEIWFLKHHRRDPQRSDRPAAGTAARSLSLPTHTLILFIHFFLLQPDS